MWTFQEFALPKREPLCICGPISFCASTLLRNRRALEDAYDALEPPELPKSESLLRDLKFQMAEIRLQLLIGKLRGEMENMSVAAMFTRWQTSTNKPRGDAQNMLELLLCTFMRQCLDPRDKVYAL